MVGSLVGCEGGLFEDLVIRVEDLGLASVSGGASDFGLLVIGE